MTELIELIKDFQPIDQARMTSPEGYLMQDNDLRAAANTALVLGKPLLLTGEAGVGKSQFANWLAFELNKQQPLAWFKFVVKSTTEARDLFYHYDALARFHEAQVHRTVYQVDSPNGIQQHSNVQSGFSSHEAHRYISYNALGMAILFSMGKSAALNDKLVTAEMQGLQQSLPEQPSRSVVLIDEIDKAPRDVPNDILDEIDNQQFTVRELGDLTAKANPEFRPIIVITSNSEKDLPKPFLRRCVYYNMRFPDDDELQRIVEQRVGARFANSRGLLGDCLRFFWFLRERAEIRRRPGLAELLDWVHELSETGERASYGSFTEVRQMPARVMSTLLKDPDDQDLLRQSWSNWVAQALANDASAE
ncbi:MAG: MoxR family ATPase [Gammaproteobacteria bacterium]|nr:MoxR family ATPase [Gammaproteobacteria bacterium]